MTFSRAPNLAHLLRRRRHLLLVSAGGCSHFHHFHLRSCADRLLQSALFINSGSALLPGNRFKSTNGAVKQFSGFIPENELDVTYSLSSGPGGQSVNKARCIPFKVATKADVRFHVCSASWLTTEMKLKLCSSMSNQMTNDGYLVFKSDRTRSQVSNRADALRKLREALWSALEKVEEPPPPDEEELERLRRIGVRAARERIKEKRTKSVNKKDRQRPDW